MNFLYLIYLAALAATIIYIIRREKRGAFNFRAMGIDKRGGEKFRAMGIDKRGGEKFHVITLSTPNYDKIGCYGANSLKKYCDLHGYLFTLYRKKEAPDLHVNFTKNFITLDALGKKNGASYVVLVDSDIEIVDPSTGVEELFSPDPRAVLYAAKDFHANPDDENSKINAGLIIWKKCGRSREINELWIEKARTECKKFADTHPRQQNVFDGCIFKLLGEEELQFLDHNKVAMLYSSFIRQTKETRGGWERMGRPDLLNCSLE